MAFGEVLHYVTQPTGWPEPVRGIASLLSPLHYADRPGGEECLASPPKPSESLSARETPSPGSFTAMDFQGLIHSTAAGLSALAELPRYGGERSTVPLWSQLLHALVRTLSSEVLILEDAPFVMPQAQNVASQPSNLIDGHATLLAAHAIFSAPRTHSDRYSTSSGSEEDEEELMYSADSDSCNGSLDSLDLPLQAHMLPGRGRCLSAVVPVLLVADARNIVPLLSSALYQRHVWGILQPVVGLCCSSTAHLALAADDHLNPLVGVFDFTDTNSATCLAQFVLGLRSHFEDIKGATSIEAVDSLTPLHWRSDLPDFETQFGGRLDERVASWTHHVHVQTSSSEASSSSTPCTPSPLSDPALVPCENMSPQDLHSIIEEEQSPSATQGDIRDWRDETVNPGLVITLGRSSRPPSLKDSSQRSSSLSRQPVHDVKKRSSSTSSRAPSQISNSSLARKSDAGLVDDLTMSNWLFERMAFTVGRIPLPGELQHETGINDMVKTYDEMTAFTWSDEVHPILSESTIDSSVLDVRSELFDKAANHISQSSAIDIPSSDVEFISVQLSALLHAVKGARHCNGVAKSHGANETEWRHEWDALLLNFFQPVPGQRDVLLERYLNSPRNLAADDTFFAERAESLTTDYLFLCTAQRAAVRSTNQSDLDIVKQAVAAITQAAQFSGDIAGRRDAPAKIAGHSCIEPRTAKCDAVLVVPCSGATTAMLQRLRNSKEKERKNFLDTFILIRGSQAEKDDSVLAKSEPSSQTKELVGPSHKSISDRHLQVPSSHVSESKKKKHEQNPLHDLFLVHPDGTLPTDVFSGQMSWPEPRDLLLPVLLSEYKKNDTSMILQATNQMRTYLVSAITFLSALGITNEPVFGLVVNGPRGAVTMAWKKGEKIYIMERNVRHYNITDPLQAFQFVAVLLRLARHGLILRQKFEEKQGAFYESISSKTFKPWSKLAQLSEEKDKSEAVQQTGSEQVGERGRSSKESGK
ncbi:uncharacterized protein EDB91DRAFT_1279845 [Suillus paluster]|uniref:uncharacterized protein n=1 Tax=Suillus paluster TaxID=48578 RepID=UPI001B870433|nr:uncharacterized protein EDB91DRAFT_1279845 [Suillus paluster]KAG1741780.1 hypothetical protein EDB91DRAFT_1279845 [Suillus paluster]